MTMMIIKYLDGSNKYDDIKQNLAGLLSAYDAT